MSRDLTQATVFYSWESDLPGKTTRSLIENCLNKAIRQLGREEDLDVDPSLDRDTRGVAGSPVILDAILEKIDNCTAFVADVSIINSKDVVENKSRPTPNPNVSIELGYAIKNCGWDRILPVCNEFYGSINQLPFDIPERRVIGFNLSEAPTPEETRAAKEKLIAIFKQRIRDILKLDRKPHVDIQVGDPETEEILGDKACATLFICEFSDYPDEQFPDYQKPGKGRFDMSSNLDTNKDYYRDIAKYAMCRNTTTKIALAITNNSSQPLVSPQLEITISTEGCTLAAHDAESFPDEPSTYPSFFGAAARVAQTKPKNEAVVTIHQNKVVIRSELENVQPARTTWTTPVYLGTFQKDEIKLNCKVYAENLSQPIEKELSIEFQQFKKEKSLKEWIESEFIAVDSESFPKMCEAKE